MFWDRKGVLLVDFLPQGSTINAGVCCYTLQKLHRTIQNKRCGMLRLGAVMIHDNTHPHTAMQNLVTNFGWEQFDHLPYSPDLAPSSCILNPSLQAGGSTKRVKSKKQLPCALHSRRHHSMMKGYKNCCSAMTSASRMLETVLRCSVQCAHQMAIYRVCNIVLFFLSSPSELTFSITYICNTSLALCLVCLWCLIFLQYQLSFIILTCIALVM